MVFDDLQVTFCCRDLQATKRVRLPSFQTANLSQVFVLYVAVANTAEGQLPRDILRSVGVQLPSERVYVLPHRCFRRVIRCAICHALEWVSGFASIWEAVLPCVRPPLAFHSAKTSAYVPLPCELVHSIPP